MNKKELIQKIKDISKLKNIDISKLNLNDKKEVLIDYLNCLNTSDFNMTLIFNKFKNLYSNFADEIKDKYLYSYFRFYVYNTVKNEG